jgi:lysophospholipase-2
MPGWSDIHGLDSESPEDRAGFEESATRVNRLIQAELDKGIPSNKIVIGGFSQGGALALHVALRSQQSFAACVALSSWVPLRKDYPAALSPAASKLPILQVMCNINNRTAAVFAFLICCLSTVVVAVQLVDITQQIK